MGEASETNSRGAPLLGGPPPAGYRLTERSRIIGNETGLFDRAAEAVLHWGVQLGSKFIPCEVPERVEIDAVSRFRIPFGPLRPFVICRVFAVVEEIDQVGFAHEAIRGHPQSGFESFIVERAADGAVSLNVRVVHRHAAWWMRMAGPGGTMALERVLHRNLRSLDHLLR